MYVGKWHLAISVAGLFRAGWASNVVPGGMMAKCGDRSCRYSLPRYQIGRFRRDLAAGLALCAVGSNLFDCAGGRMNSALRSIQRADARWGKRYTSRT